MFRLNGRMGRLSYFFTSVFCWILLSFPAYYFWRAEMAVNFFVPSMFFWAIGWMIMIWGIAWLWSASVRRLHDFNASGFWVILVYLLPVSVIVLWLWPGTQGENLYGLRP